MKSNKMLYVAISVAVVSVMILVGVLVTTLGKSGNKMTNGMNAIVTGYLKEVNAGEYDKSYLRLSPTTQSFVSYESYANLMYAMLGEDDAKLEIDQTKDVISVTQKAGDTEYVYTGVPIIRTYTQTLDGQTSTVKEDLIMGMSDEEDGYKVYMTDEVYYDYVVKYVLGKANECAIEALENKNTLSIVAKNAEKIDVYLSYANEIPSTYAGYSDAAIDIDLITSYKLLAEGQQDSALSKIQSSYSRAETDEQKIRVLRVESEVYYASGNYSEAVNSLKKALDVDPTNSDARRDYRRINSMMLDQIESSLSRGWSQLQSAIKQDVNEMDRILSDIAFTEAQKAIEVKPDAPDGYYLKGNIEYCLGDYNAAISSLEMALQLAKSEDNEFKTKTAEILGMAKMNNASSDKVRDIDSYQRVFDKDVRSLLFRESEVSGIVDTIK